MRLQINKIAYCLVLSLIVSLMVSSCGRHKESEGNKATENKMQQDKQIGASGENDDKNQAICKNISDYIAAINIALKNIQDEANHFIDKAALISLAAEIEQAVQKPINSPAYITAINGTIDALSIKIDSMEAIVKKNKPDQIKTASIEKLKGYKRQLETVVNQLHDLELQNSNCKNSTAMPASEQVDLAKLKTLEDDLFALKNSMSAFKEDTQAQLTDKDYEDPIFLPIYLAILLTWVAIGCFVFMDIKEKNQQKKEFEQEIMRLTNSIKQQFQHNERKLSAFQDKYSEKTQEIAEQLRLAHKKITGLEEKIAVLKQNNSVPPTKKRPLSKPESLPDFDLSSLVKGSKSDNSAAHSPYTEIFFAPAPDNDNCFDTKHFETHQSGDVSYKISLLKDGRAEFELINETEIVKFATRYPESVLFKACDSDYPVNREAAKIITLKPGIASKQGNKWLITEKAKIRYDL